MKLPLVSIIMNCYNGEPYLREAIDSALAQTYPSWEIVFWDNCSTDSSPVIVRSYRDPRIRYFRATEHTSLGMARKLALQQALGTYFLLLDTDDLLLPEALETMVKALEGQEYALAFAGSIVIDASGNELQRWIPKARRGNLFEDQLRQFEIRLPAVMVRMHAMRKSDINFDGCHHSLEDYALFMSLAAEQEIRALSKIVAKYRVHDKSLSAANLGTWAGELERALREIRARHPGIEETYPRGFRAARARSAYYRARYFVSRRQRWKALNELFGFLLVDYRYIALFLLLLLPLPVWDRVHQVRTHRPQRTL